MNKFKRYKCDTCNKETDVENDIKRVFIDKCSLTAGCKGRLRLVSEKNIKENILNFNLPSQSEEINTGESSEVSIGEYISLASASENVIYLAVKKGLETYPQNSPVLLNMREIVSKEQAFKEFQFNVSVPASAISGKDGSVDKRILTFSPTDTIEVFVNGEVISPSLYTAENNIIKFNETVVYTTFNSSSLFVRVLVFAKEPETTKTISFSRNFQNLGTGAWSNANEISIAGEQYEVYVCSDFSSITLNSRLTAGSVSRNGVVLANDRVMFLLAQAPFGVSERIVSKCINFAGLTDVLNHVRYSVESGQNRVLVTSQTLKSVFPVIHVTSYFDKATEFSFDYTSASSDVELNNYINKKDSFILGPV